MNEQTIGDLIKSLALLKAEKKRLDTDLELIESRISHIESVIMNALEADGINESASTYGKVTRSVHVYPKLEGWDLLEAHIFATQSLVLLEKRIAVTPYREMLTLRREVPGVIPYEKRKLTFRPMNNED
jgi:hypothetical protein